MDQAIADAGKGRIVSIDVLKGVAAYLVVLGHIVTGKEECRGIYNLIYAFHMPLFMFLAGCTVVLSYRNCSGKMTYLARRFVNIMVPYLTWSFCLPVITAGSVVRVNWKSVFIRTFIKNRMFWFLPTLYGLIIGYVCYCRIREEIRKRDKWSGAGEVTAAVVDAVSCICVTGIFALLMFWTKYQLFRDIVGFTIPFFAAVMYMEHKWVYDLLHRQMTVFIAFIIFILLIGRFDFSHASIATSLLRMLLGMCASIILLWFFERLPKPGVVNRLLILFGRSSLLIYILHIWILNYSRLASLQIGDASVKVMWYCAVSLLVCGVCAILFAGLSRIPVVRLLLLGKMEGGYAKRQ